MRRKVLVDTREQLPWTEWEDRGVEVRKLDQGDYALDGLETFCAVERKSLADFVMCCGSERERFQREMARFRELVRFPFVVIEASPLDVARRAYPGIMEPAAVIATTLAFTLDYDVYFVWAGNRDAANGIARRLWDVVEKRIKRMRPKVRAKKVKEDV